MSSAFSNQTLAEKLAKLNSSQQSIETLSHWCIFHRKKARHVVETWEKLFDSAPKEQKVSFLYLANDILQNSRRKGSEFVNEFWKVLPGALKNVYEHGDDQGKSVVMRLVDIWDERKVFGSRGQGLKDDILGKSPPPPPVLENNGKSLTPIKLVRKDAHSIRIKLTVGGMPEKIITAYQSVLDEHFNEDTALNKCKAAVNSVEKIETSIDDAVNQGNFQGSAFLNELQEHETNLMQCIHQLESVETSRAVLITQLKEALEEQGSKVELIHSQLQVAKSKVEGTNSLRQKIMSATSSGLGLNSFSSAPIITAMSAETTVAVVHNLPHQAMPPLQTSSAPPLQPPQPVTSFTSSVTSAEDQHKKAAAAVAAKLAASTSSAQMLTSVLSSLVAEEAAAMNGVTSSGVINSNPRLFPVDKRPKLEKPMSVSDISSSFSAQLQQQQLSSMPLGLPQSSAGSLQPVSQTNQQALTFPLPPPPLPPVPPPAHQYVQTSGVMVGGVPYGYGGSTLPPPPPLPSNVMMGLARPGAPQPPTTPPPQQNQQQQQQIQQQQPQQQPHSVNTGFFQSPGMGFYGQPQTAPPVPRQ